MTVGIILAGGRGSRMAPWTDRRGKFLVPYFDSTVLHETFGFLTKCGARRFVVFVAAEFAAETRIVCGKAGLPVDVIVARSDSWELHWAQVAAAASNERAVLINCDLILDPRWAAVVTHHEAVGLAVTIGAAPPGVPGRGKVVRRLLGSDGVLRSTSDTGAEARRIALIGLSVVEPETWEVLGELDYSCPDPFTDRLLDRMLSSGGVSFTEWDIAARDVGTWPGLLAAHLEATDPGRLWHREGTSWCHEKAYVSAGAQLRNAVLWPGARVEGREATEELLVMPDACLTSGQARTAVWTEPGGSTARAHW